LCQELNFRYGFTRSRLGQHLCNALCIISGFHTNVILTCVLQVGVHVFLNTSICVFSFETIYFSLEVRSVRRLYSWNIEYTPSFCSKTKTCHTSLRISCIFIFFHIFSRIYINFHRFSLIFMDLHRFTWIFMDLRGSGARMLAARWRPVVPNRSGLGPPNLLKTSDSGGLDLEAWRLDAGRIGMDWRR
jgi:hypothetical protein